MTDYIVPWLLVGLSGLLAVLIPLFLVSGIDDFLVDVYYIARTAYRKLTAQRRQKTVGEKELRQVRERYVDIQRQLKTEPRGPKRTQLVNEAFELRYKS